MMNPTPLTFGGTFEVDPCRCVERTANLRASESIDRTFSQQLVKLNPAKAAVGLRIRIVLSGKVLSQHFGNLANKQQESL